MREMSNSYKGTPPLHAITLNIEFSNKGSGQTDLWVFLRYEENIFGAQAPASQSAKDQQ